MRLDPAIAELRRDPAPQLRAQAALEEVRDRWRASQPVGALMGELDRYGAGGPLSDCPHLERTISDPIEGMHLIEPLFVALAGALANHPLGHVPIRHQYAQNLGVLQLAVSRRASLSIIIYEQPSEARAPAQTIAFSDGERHELCLAGSAEVRLFEIHQYDETGRAIIDCESRTLVVGDAMAFIGPSRTKIIDRPRGRVVLLRLSRSATAPIPTREIRIADGAIVHQASGSREESRDEMAVAVLGAMDRADAVPVLLDLIREDASDHLRWQALRQALALDTAAGFDALTAVAKAHADPLAVPAAELRTRLVELHPALARRNEACPA